MSSEWTIVTGNKRNVKVVAKQPVAVVEKKVEVRQVRPTREEKIQKENERREQWEQRRQKKIDEYNAEFPLLPGSKDLVPDAKKIAYIDAKIAARKEANHKAYLEREARRQEKAKREAEKAKRDAEIAEAEAKRQAELYKIAEEEHVKDMIEKWGYHRWYRMVAWTEDDCDTAERLRHEEEEREWRMEQYEREQEEEEERREAIRQAEKEKYIAEQTANMSEREKEQWIRDYEYEEMRILEDQVFSYWDSVYYDNMRQERADKERLDRWNAKHGKK